MARPKAVKNFAVRPEGRGDADGSVLLMVMEFDLDLLNVKGALAAPGPRGGTSSTDVLSSAKSSSLESAEES